LKYLPRVNLEVTSEGDFETDSMRFKGYGRYAYGFTDPFGLYGAQGF
jgi:hypothetical protein